MLIYDLTNNTISSINLDNKFILENFLSEDKTDSQLFQCIKQTPKQEENYKKYEQLLKESIIYIPFELNDMYFVKIERNKVSTKQWEKACAINIVCNSLKELKSKEERLYENFFFYILYDSDMNNFFINGMDNKNLLYIPKWDRFNSKKTGEELLKNFNKDIIKLALFS